MFYRQKVLLGLLEAFGGELQRTDFQKYLFLYTRLCEIITTPNAKQQRAYELLETITV